MIDLSKNTNPYYPDKSMLRFLKRKIKNVKKYSEKHVSIFEDNVLNKYNLKSENVVITNGTMDAMDLILKTYKNKSIGLFDPTFWGIKEIARINNNKIIKKKLIIDYKYNIDEIDKLASKTDVLYLCNCNNPTLNFIESEKLIEIVKKNKNCLFVIDETVLIFDEEYDRKTSIKFVNNVKNLVVIISLSKIFGVCGMRIGLIITSVNQKNKLLRVQVPYSNNSLSVLFLKKYFNQIFLLNKCKKKIKNNFYYLIKNLDYKLIDRVLYNSSSFLLLKLKDDNNYENIVDFISNNDIKIAAINNYYKSLENKYLRVSAGKKKDFKKLIQVLEKYENIKLNEK